MSGRHGHFVGVSRAITIVVLTCTERHGDETGAAICLSGASLPAREPFIRRSARLCLLHDEPRPAPLLTGNRGSRQRNAAFKLDPMSYSMKPTSVETAGIGQRELALWVAPFDPHLGTK